MSTRAIIEFKGLGMGDDGNVTVYVHGDGHPKWLGIDLANALKQIELVNGMSLDEKYGECANTSGDLFLQVIDIIKQNRVGYVYLTNRDITNKESMWDIDYTYFVKVDSDNGSKLIKCVNVTGSKFVTPSEFIELVNEQIKAAS